MTRSLAVLAWSIRFHALALDRELEELAGRGSRSAGEWASRAATPIV